jgi:hypothetical protein
MPQAGSKLSSIARPDSLSGVSFDEYVKSPSLQVADDSLSSLDYFQRHMRLAPNKEFNHF